MKKAIHRCRLCFRCFENGRALGGHMRSHTMKFYGEKREKESSLEDSFSFSDEVESSSPEVRGSVLPGPEISPEEQMAHCLIMLSRDKWERGEFEEFDEFEHKFSDSGESSEDSGEDKIGIIHAKGKYKCEACNKFFRSYQALGGHKASHKKIKLAARRIVIPAEERIHQCPFCRRIFPSGQALGGHKRSHFHGGATALGEALKIDLNLPAPTEDSTVSDGELVHAIGA